MVILWLFSLGAAAATLPPAMTSAAAEAAMVRAQLSNLEAEKAIVGTAPRQQVKALAEEMEQARVDERQDDRAAAAGGAARPKRAAGREIAALSRVEAATAADEGAGSRARAQQVRSEAEVARALDRDEQDARAVLRRVAKLVASQGTDGTVKRSKHVADALELRRLQSGLHYRRDMGLLHSEAALLKLIRQTQRFENRLLSQVVLGEYQRSQRAPHPRQPAHRRPLIKRSTWFCHRRGGSAACSDLGDENALSGNVPGHGTCVGGICRCERGSTYSSHDNRCWNEQPSAAARPAATPRPTPQPPPPPTPPRPSAPATARPTQPASAKAPRSPRPPPQPLGYPSKLVRCAAGSFPITMVGGGAVCGLPRDHCSRGSFYPAARRWGPGAAMTPSPCALCPAGKTSARARLSCRWLRRDESPLDTRKRLHALHMRGSGISADTAETGAAAHADKSSNTALHAMLVFGCITLAVSSVTLGVGSGGAGLPFKVRQMLHGRDTSRNRFELGGSLAYRDGMASPIPEPIPGDVHLAERKTLLSSAPSDGGEKLEEPEL
jgi:hypothetical protein